MLDVTVKLLRDGVVVNSNESGGGGSESGSTTAVLGLAVLGKMKLGES